MENEKKLTRSSNRMIAGVCAGIAEYFGWDPTLLRIVYILATFFTAFAGVIIYIILWIVMPGRRPSDRGCGRRWRPSPENAARRTLRRRTYAGSSAS